jgi:hypothetical protein
MRPLLTLALTFLATSTFADSEASWIQFRQDVAAACLALVDSDGEITTEVNPFGSERFGLALITVTTEAGTDRVGCVYEKGTGRAELTAPFAPT